MNYKSKTIQSIFFSVASSEMSKCKDYGNGKMHEIFHRLLEIKGFMVHKIRAEIEDELEMIF